MISSTSETPTRERDNGSLHTLPAACSGRPHECWEVSAGADGQQHAPRILFDCPGALPVLVPDAPGGIGGAEVRAIQFARVLASGASACDVSVLVAGDNVDRRDEASPLTVRCEPPMHASRRPGLHAIPAALGRAAERLSASAMQRCLHLPPRHSFCETLDYDLLVCFGVHNRTASLVRSARRAGRRVIVCLTSDRTLVDLQLRGRKQRGAYGEIGYLCRYALRNADAVVTQKRSQQLTIWRDWHVPSVLIRNPIDLRDQTSCSRESALRPTGDELEAAVKQHQPYVLWVGRADCFSKRADLCLHFARACPECNFVVVMNRTDGHVFDTLTRDLPANVQLYEKVPPSCMDPLYRHATLLLNTSNAEGFPNSFLQAGKHGVPVVSWQVDPDGMLHEQGCGVCCDGDLEMVPRVIRFLMRRDPAYQSMSAAIAKYVHQHHDLQLCGQQFAGLVRDVLQGRGQ
jgi:glycosyltransferase involved in cell wall biosynthesis